MNDDFPPIIAWFVFYGAEVEDDTPITEDVRRACGFRGLSGDQKGRFDTEKEAQLWADEKVATLTAAFPQYKWSAEVTEAVLTDPRPNGESYYLDVESYIRLYGVDPRQDTELVRRPVKGSKEYLEAQKEAGLSSE